jgi:hypothetical protein
MSRMFAACQRFDQRNGDSWSRFIEWTGFQHIREIVSIDTMLCPSLIDELADEDWQYNIHADYRTSFFRDAKYLRRRIDYDCFRHNILALTKEPTSFVEPPNGFAFRGYDILDSYDSISVLTNCGAFPSIYSVEDINEYALVSDLDRVTEIASAIRKPHWDDHRRQECRVWGIARYVDVPTMYETIR